MKSELVVDVQPNEIAIALLEDGRLMSLQKEARNIKYAVGDVYLGKIKKLMPGLNAAFVHGRDGGKATENPSDFQIQKFARY